VAADIKVESSPAPVRRGRKAAVAVAESPAPPVAPEAAKPVETSRPAARGKKAAAVSSAVASVEVPHVPEPVAPEVIEQPAIAEQSPIRRDRKERPPKSRKLKVRHRIAKVWNFCFRLLSSSV
jgi:hypothetical protein